MVSKSMQATVAGWGVVAAATLFYAYEVLANGTREQAIMGAALITAAAFIAVIIYEDWKDAKRHGRNGNHPGKT